MESLRSLSPAATHELCPQCHIHRSPCREAPQTTAGIPSRAMGTLWGGHFNNLLGAVSVTGSVWGHLGACELRPAALQRCHCPGSSWAPQTMARAGVGKHPAAEAKIKVFVLQTWSRHSNGTGTQEHPPSPRCRQRAGVAPEFAPLEMRPQAGERSCRRVQAG